VIDHGLSRWASGAALSSGCARGGDLWRAPELHSPARRTNTPAADIWAAGLILFEISSGRIAYCRDGGIVTDYAALIKAGRSPEDVSELPPSTHPTVAAVARACVRLDPEARINAADAFVMLYSSIPVEDAIRYETPGLRCARRASLLATAASGREAGAEALCSTMNLDAAGDSSVHAGAGVICADDAVHPGREVADDIVRDNKIVISAVDCF
jgi:serine/threonine protein kinase